MADLIDVLEAVKAVVLAVAYPPDGTVQGNGLSTACGGCAVLAVAGRPGANDLDAVAASLGMAAPRVVVSVESAPGMMRNTTRFPQRWRRKTAGPTTLTVTVDATGTMATIGGTAPGAAGPAQNIALVLRYGGSPARAFVHAVQPGDTLDSIAAALAALVDAETPATAAGAAVTIPAAFGLLGRVGGVATMQKPLMQQVERILVNVWAPAGPASAPQLRDLAAAPIKQAIAGMRFLTLADGTGGRIVTCGDALLDDPEKAGLYRRMLMYDVEYSTTVEDQAAVAIAAAAALQGGARPVEEFTENAPPVVQVEA